MLNLIIIFFLNFHLFIGNYLIFTFICSINDVYLLFIYLYVIQICYYYYDLLFYLNYFWTSLIHFMIIYFIVNDFLYVMVFIKVLCGFCVMIRFMMNDKGFMSYEDIIFYYYVLTINLLCIIIMLIKLLF